tara:strand:+ start:333 stop:572 length:240 start_codon:yes stop_codon:yes gene_type:complete
MGRLRKGEIRNTSILQNRVKDARNADSRVKYCIQCRKCWEILTIDNFSKKSRDVRYYDDFPSYGKVKQKCDKCKGEINE